MPKETLSGNYATPVTLGGGIYADPVTVTGTMSLSGSGIDLLAPTAWSIVNAGRIESPGTTATGASAGIALEAGGSVDNFPGGTIDGYRHGVALYNVAGTVTNAGTIMSTYTHTGAVALDAGGTLINQAGGFISGAIAAYSYGGGTVINAGTIVGTGTDDTAVFLFPNHANRLVIDPGASFSGAVSGGNSVGAAFVSTLELASGASAGTLNGLGSKYVRFAAVTVDAGASWDLAGYNAVAAGMTLTDSGYLTDGGFLSNAGAVVGTLNVGTGGAFANLPSGTAQGVQLNAPGVGFANQGRVASLFVAPGNSPTNATGGTISGAVQFVSGGAVSTLVNQAGALIGGSLQGGAGDAIDNAGAIAGSVAFAVDAGGSVVNSGSIGSGISMTADGSVTNAAGGIISTAGELGVSFTDGYAILDNAGRISAAGSNAVAIGIDRGSGNIYNGPGGVIEGGYSGVTFAYGGLLTNAGTIVGSAGNGFAVLFQGGSASRLIVDPGAVFSGKVDGGNTVGATAASVLELAAGADTLTGIGSSFTNFSTIDFDAGAAWFISGSTAAFAGGQTITGFARGDTIGLTGVTAAVSGFADGTLALSGGLDLLLPDAHYSAAQFLAVENGGNTDLSIACFRAGTHVLTERGERPVEAMRPGMRLVSLLHRRLLPVRWVGQRRLRCARHPRPEALWPVRIEADAFAAGVPHCSLHLSPDHAVFTGQALIPVRHLLNGCSIAQVPCEEVTYFHIELAEHAVLLAEGVPAESYLDTGNRAAFSNGGNAVAMHPDFSRRAWQAKGCAPLAVAGAAVVAERQRLLARAAGLGWRTTHAAAPMLLVNSGSETEEILLPLPMRGEREGQHHASFALPAGARMATLCSRVSVPAQLDPAAPDHRRLGLAVVTIELDDVPVTLADARLGEGWHAPEPGLRWTDGAARIDVSGARLLTVRTVPLLKYWVQRGGRKAAAGVAGQERKEDSPQGR